MSILIVDDSQDELLLLQRILNNGGYKEILLAMSANEAFDILKLENSSSADVSVDLILMDIMMPEIDGIEACSKIKGDDRLKDIPIVIVTASSDVEKLHWAFSAGAVDYIGKPVKKVELLARVSSALRLKHEIDNRKAHEKELEDLTRKLETANKRLEQMSMTDGLTGIANRRYFDEIMQQEWLRAARGHTSLSLILVDIDYFKAFNDTYGHQAGDYCLKKIASALKDALNRPADLITRYGGEEFAAILPETDINGGVVLAEAMRKKVAKLNLPHKKSKTAAHVSISLGVSSAITEGNSLTTLIGLADKALYKAKDNGRNRVEGYYP